MYLHKAPSAAPGLRGDAPDLFLGTSALISKPQDPWVQHRFSKHPDFATESHINSSGNEFVHLTSDLQMFRFFCFASKCHRFICLSFRGFLFGSKDRLIQQRSTIRQSNPCHKPRFCSSQPLQESRTLALVIDRMAVAV